MVPLAYEPARAVKHGPGMFSDCPCVCGALCAVLKHRGAGLAAEGAAHVLVRAFACSPSLLLQLVALSVLSAGVLTGSRS